MYSSFSVEQLERMVVSETLMRYIQEIFSQIDHLTPNCIACKKSWEKPIYFRNCNINRILDGKTLTDPNLKLGEVNCITN